MVRIDQKVKLGDSNLFVICGPCVIETEESCFSIAKKTKTILEKHGIPFVFKASFDKANRTSISSFRGPGLRRGLEILARVKKKLKIPILTDVHEPWQAEPAGRVCDILQIPAFLSRQTDLIVAAAKTGKTVNIKKGQFMAPEDLNFAVEKILAQKNKKILITERGTSFGYRNLIVDMRSIPFLKKLGVPIIFDATHSVQKPGGQGKKSGGDAKEIPALARAAVAAGADGVFLEVHPNPVKAKSDGANALPLRELSSLANILKKIHGVIKNSI